MSKRKCHFVGGFSIDLIDKAGEVAESLRTPMNDDRRFADELQRRRSEAAFERRVKRKNFKCRKYGKF